MRSCEEIRDRLVAFAEGELNQEESRRVETHLAGCAACGREAALLTETLARVRALPEPEAPDGFWDDFGVSVQQRIAAESPPRLPYFRRVSAWFDGFSWLRPVPVLGAAAALGLLLAIGLVRSPRTSRDLPAGEVLMVGESLPIAQDLDLLEQFDLLEDLDLLEHFSILQAPEFGKRLKRG